MNKTPIVNIVTVTYNRLSLTKQSLPNVMSTASSNIDWLHTVVDNGSTDGTVEYLKELFLDSQIDNLILLKENIGVAKGSNLGWKLFEEIPYYIKVDNDVMFHKDNWLDEMVTILVNAPEIGALGYNAEGKNLYPVVSNAKVRYRNKTAGNIGGCCFMVPKHVHDKLGFWNEDFDLYGEEDAAMGTRISVAGYINAYMEDETVLDLLPEEVDEYRIFKNKQREENLKGLFQSITGEYHNKTRPLRVETNILKEVDFEWYSHYKEIVR